MVMDNFHGFPAVKQRYWLVFTVGFRYKTKQTTQGCPTPSGDERLPRATPVVVSGATVRRNLLKKESSSGQYYYTFN